MTEVRKSGKQTAARKRAREKAAQFREKQDQLEQLAVDYFELADSIEDFEMKVEKEIAAARARTDALIAGARAKSDAVIATMLSLGTPRPEVAGRLGIATRDIKKTTGAAATPTVAKASAATASDDGDTPTQESATTAS